MALQFSPPTICQNILKLTTYPWKGKCGGYLDTNVEFCPKCGAPRGTA